MMVKICGITNVEDARAAAAAGASALGFNFYPESPRYIAPRAAQAILDDIASKLLKVGVFVNSTAGHTREIAETVGLDIVQLHGDAAELPEGLRVWRAMRMTPDFKVGSLDAMPEEAFLLDTPSTTLHGGTGMTFDWRLARGAKRRVILAGGLDELNVRYAIEAAQPWGVDACSRLESSPGRKDHNKMERFIQAALS